jgi:hypothetical protein
LCSLSTVTRIRSDHTSLLLSSGERSLVRPNRFFFQTWWLGRLGFKDMLSDKLTELAALTGPCWNSVDFWQEWSRGTRQFLKG